MSDPDTGRPDATFRDVDLTQEDARGSTGALPGRSTLGAVLLAAGWVALFVYDRWVLGPDEPTTPWWDATLVDWLFVPSFAVAVLAVAGAARSSPRLTRRRLRALGTDPVAVLTGTVLAVVVVYGLAGPMVLGEPELRFRYDHQPPVWASVNAEYVASCYGPVVEGRCQGTWRYPLGTTRNGNDLLVRLSWGARTVVQAGFVTAALVVPLSSLAGVVGAQYGGRVDRALLRYLDLQQSVLPLLVYLLLHATLDAGLLTLVVVFGVMDAGGVARTVRTRARALTSEGYVRASAAAGASDWTVARRHLLPNVLGVAVTGAALLVARVVLAEAALSFLGLGQPLTTSWGETMQDVLRHNPFVFWWVAAETTALLAGVVVSLQLFGEALGDAMDPERQ